MMVVRRRRSIPIAEILKKAVPQKARARLFSVELVRRGWEEVVGPELAERSEPHALTNGVLTVRVGDARWGQMVHQLQHTIIPKLNKCIGLPLVRRINFARYAGEPSQFRRPKAKGQAAAPPAPTPPVIRVAAESLAESLGDRELAELVARVAAKDLGRRENRPGRERAPGSQSSTESTGP